ncbi:LysR family transcriptional regulator, partial [Sutterella sp.]|uniref:LysR family transcriptional regulator n=1 Tax=Sutterella sp. TaxID=1981025 RepID=UPI0026E0F506
MRDTLLFWNLILACQRTKSLAKACVQMNLSLSAGSKLIAAFEEETDLTLLDRSTRPAGLTGNLERLLPVAARMVKAHADAERAVQTLRAEAAGDFIHGRVVRICLPVNVRSNTMLERLLTYADANPGLRLEFLGDDGFRRLMKGEVEIAQFGFHPKRPELRADFIRTNAFLMLASRRFCERHGLPKTVEELERFRVAIRNPENRSFSRRLRNGDRTFFLPDGPNLVYADTITCRDLLLSGQAISLDVSISTVLAELKAGLLVPVLPGWHRKPNDTYVCCHMRFSGDPVIN